MADGLLNKANIILTPTGYKAGTLYNVAPVVEPYEDFDFARASVASRVNSSGLVEMVGRTLGSELVTNGDFATDSDWSKSGNVEISGGSANFDIISGAFTRILQNITLTNSKTYKLTLQVIGDNSAKQIKVRDTASGDAGGLQEVITLVEGTTNYTFYFTANANSDAIYIKRQTSSGDYEFSIDNVSVKEIIDTNNIPRISYDSNGQNGHILLEPTSTNFLPYSNDFSQSNWVKQTNITATYNTTETLSPDGTYNATKLVGDGTDGIFDSSLSITGDVTRSVYLKSVSGTVTLKLKDSNINIGIETLTVTTEWQRFYLSGDNGSSLQGIFIFNIPSSGVYMWGAQVENSPYPTSYIPTLTGSTVTRATETATGAGSAELINSTEGVLYAEIAALVNGGDDRIISLSDETNNNLIYIRIDNTSNRINCFARGGGGTYNILTVNGVNQTNTNKIALVWDASNVRVWINGSQSLTQSINNTPTGMKTLSFTSPTGGSPFYGKVKAVAVFNEALSDSELTQLTT